MNAEFEQLYKEMLAAKRQCGQYALAETERAETCYSMAKSYWHRVKEKFIARGVNTKEEEIDFFKSVKPLFTCHIEYYLILNQGLLFIPEKINERIIYWEEEAKRCQRFLDRNRDFIQYYESNNDTHDAEYFLRRSERKIMSPQERIYEDHDCRSSHDHIVRGWLANKMYHEYVIKKLEELKLLTK